MAQHGRGGLCARLAQGPAFLAGQVAESYRWMGQSPQPASPESCWVWLLTLPCQGGALEPPWQPGLGAPTTSVYSLGWCLLSEFEVVS